MNILKVYGLNQEQIDEFGARLDESLRECLRISLSSGWRHLSAGKEGTVFFMPSQGMGNAVLVQVELFGEISDGYDEVSKKVSDCLKIFFPDSPCQCSVQMQLDRFAAFSQK